MSTPITNVQDISVSLAGYDCLVHQLKASFQEMDDSKDVQDAERVNALRLNIRQNFSWLHVCRRGLERNQQWDNVLEPAYCFLRSEMQQRTAKLWEKFEILAGKKLPVVMEPVISEEDGSASDTNAVAASLPRVDL